MNDYKLPMCFHALGKVLESTDKPMITDEGVVPATPEVVALIEQHLASGGIDGH